MSLTLTKRTKKRKFKNVEDKITECLDPRKTKMIFDFNDRESANIESFAVKKKKKKKKKKNEIKVTSRFMSGKLPMSAKLSLKSFIYALVETFYFPSQLVLNIYIKYKIEKIEINHVFTDTDSNALQFIIISDPNSDIPEPKFRGIIFEIIVATKLYKRFDSSHESWDTFGARKLNRKKKLGHYEVESIDNPCYVTIAVNPKEYFEVFKNYKGDKKHKGIKKGSLGMELNNFAGRIKSLLNFDKF